MGKIYKDINEEFVHDFIEILSEKAEEVKASFGNFSDLESDNPLNFVQRLIFPNQDFRAHPVGGGTPPQVLTPSGHTYFEEDECDYLYGFTNSEFIAFLGRLSPNEFLIIISIIAILIAQCLNLNELLIIALLVEGIGDQLELLAEYADVQDDIKSDEEEREQNEALQKDFEYIFEQLCKMQEQIKSLESQLADKDSSCITPPSPKLY